MKVRSSPGQFVLAAVASYGLQRDGRFCNGQAGAAELVENIGWIDATMENNPPIVLPDPVGTIRLRFRRSNKCVDIDGASTASGANVQQWDCVDVPQQRFDVLPVDDGFLLRA